VPHRSGLSWLSGISCAEPSKYEEIWGAKLNPSEERAFLPKDDRLPSFAYGLLKSNQIAHKA
jgi:hypothetical protein